MLASPIAPSASALQPLTRVAILVNGPVDAALVDAVPHAGFVVVETRDVRALQAVYGERMLPSVSARADALPNDTYWGSQWGPQALDMPDAWALEVGNLNVTVAVIDSGIDDTHPDFAGVPIVRGTDYVDAANHVNDQNGHGTHVAGIIGAARGNSLGVAGLARVTLMPIRVLDASGNGDCLNVALAVLEAAARGASIINLSLECATDYAPLHLAIQAATAAGVLVVAAAGNYGSDRPCPSFPGAYPEVLSVAALDSAASVADYSCRGANVELAAPGTGVLSTWLHGTYVELSGTSMAAPHVSAIAALVKSHFPELQGSAIRARLDATAIDIGPSGRDPASGLGRVDPVAALTS